MADIFLSYAREDVESARAIAQALETRGWNVWWDRSIAPGQSFDEVIERELRAARCVIVLWSTQSVESRWVRGEAGLAADAGTLVPVLIEANVDIPLSFRSVQCADLSEWDGQGDAEQFQALVAALFARVGPVVVTDDRVPPPPVVTRRRWLPWSVAGAAIVTTVIVSLVLWDSAAKPDAVVMQAGDTLPDSLRRPAIASTTVGNVSYALMGVFRRDVTLRDFELVLYIKVNIGAEPGINFWQDLFRLDINGTRIAPSNDGSNKYVPAFSEWMEGVRFRVPTGLTKATLYVGKVDAGRTSPIVIPDSLLAKLR